jgi:hypothetical protein
LARPEVIIRCDGCWKNGTVEALTVEDARQVAAAEAGWSTNGYRDWCLDCTTKQTVRREQAERSAKG